jgi:hypothetical protein
MTGSSPRKNRLGALLPPLKRTALFIAPVWNERKAYQVYMVRIL